VINKELLVSPPLKVNVPDINLFNNMTSILAQALESLSTVCSKKKDYSIKLASNDIESISQANIVHAMESFKKKSKKPLKVEPAAEDGWGKLIKTYREYNGIEDLRLRHKRKYEELFKEYQDFIEDTSNIAYYKSMATSS
jgi:hypothetical protein